MKTNYYYLLIITILVISSVSALQIRDFPQSISITAGESYSLPFKLYIDYYPHNLQFFLNVTSNTSSMDGLSYYVSYGSLDNGFQNAIFHIDSSSYFAPNNFTISLYALDQQEIPAQASNGQSGSGGTFIPIPVAYNDIIQFFNGTCTTFTNKTSNKVILDVCPKPSLDNSTTNICMVNGTIVDCDEMSIPDSLISTPKTPMIFRILAVLGILVIIVVIYQIFQNLYKTRPVKTEKGGQDEQ